MFVIASPKGAKQSRGLEEIATAPAAPRNDKHPRSVHRFPPPNDNLAAFPFAPMLVTLAKVIPEHVEGIDTCVVSVGPDEAESIGADPAHAHGADGRRNILRCRRLRMISKLSPTPGARAVQAERHPTVGRPAAVGPPDRGSLVGEAPELYGVRPFWTQRLNRPFHA